MAVAVGFRRRLQTGPALRISKIPLGSLILSAVLHGALIAAGVIAVNAIKDSQPKVYVVNLVPAVPAIGRPEGRTSAPAPPTPREVPPAPAAEKPPPPTELPSRTAVPDLPPRPSARHAKSLPARSLPPRTTAPTATPRPDQKELPPVASATSSTATTPLPPREAAPPPPPPAPLGVAVGGSPHGKGRLSIDVDFPYAWYIKILHDKIHERWDPHAIPGQQPLIAFDIGRKGDVDPARVVVRQSSGNPRYDRVAMRAILDAAPFPPLPDDFKNERVTIVIGFTIKMDRG